jgi:hypothetical protein
MNHRWESLLFLHWAVSAARVQRTLPAGLTVDTFEGHAYLGIIPFFMRRVRLRGLPPVPGLSAFQELNVRTYVYDKEGVPGVWFYSLSCNQPLAVAAARLFTGLNYMTAKMTADRSDLINYTCRRKRTAAVAGYRYRGEGAAQEAGIDSLEFFLSLCSPIWFAPESPGVTRALFLPEGATDILVADPGAAGRFSRTHR